MNNPRKDDDRQQPDSHKSCPPLINQGQDNTRDESGETLNQNRVKSCDETVDSLAVSRQPSRKRSTGIFRLIEPTHRHSEDFDIGIVSQLFSHALTDVVENGLLQ